MLVMKVNFLVLYRYSVNIADAISTQSSIVEKLKSRLPEGGVRHTGSFEVDIQLHFLKLLLPVTLR